MNRKSTRRMNPIAVGPTVVILLTALVPMVGCPPTLLDRLDEILGTELNPPIITSITPNSGSAAGGTAVTIRGVNFEIGTGVLFGSTSAKSVNRVNSNLLEVVTPAGAPGPVTVTVVSGDKQSAIFESGFSFDDDAAASDAPSVTLIEPDRAPILGGTRVTITGEGFEQGTQVIFGGFLGADAEMISDRQLRVIAPAQASGMVDVMIRRPDGRTVVMDDAFEFVEIANADSEIIRQLETRFPGGPRVVSAVATSNTSIQVTFSEPVSQSALNHDNYSMVIPEGGVLLLDPAVALRLSVDQTVVFLTTLGMSGERYQLTVSAIQDLAGHSLAAPDILVNPTQTEFTGIPPALVGDQKDTDGDGFADWFEMLGWSVNIELANGVRTQAHVTSNPFDPDTDGDGVNDSVENAYSLDPRTDDTDADLVSDADELNVYLSNPADQDTDDDGFSDSLELFYKTSPTLADTDGDQLDDREELVIRNRNPRLADLPIPQIVIGESNIEVDERFTYTDEMGVQQSTEASSSFSLTQSESTGFSKSDTRSNEATDSRSQQIKVGGEGVIGGDGKPGIKIGGEASFGFGQQSGRGYSSTISEESSRTTQQQYSEALSQALSISERQSVTRTVDAARVTVDLSIANAGGIAFTIRNLEVSARVKDPNSRDRFVPMATLLPSSGNNEYNLGPTGSQRGPFIFENSEIFPNLAQSLLREPRAIIFDIANFDIEDEFGRNFAYTAEEINDLTAELSIDFGDGSVELYRVATASTFNASGIANGITMREALTGILGFSEVNDEDTLPAGADLNNPAIRDSFGTNIGRNGEQILTRIRSVQTEFDTLDPAAKFWVVLSNADIPDDLDFGDLVLKPGDSYRFWYVQDADDDGLFAREEFLAGCSDSLVDTDGDGISDFDEVRTGWLTAIPGNNRRVYSHPGLADTDGDQIPDDLERRLGSDPRSADTDGDGLDDRIEVLGYNVVLLDSDNDPLNDVEVIVAPYSDAAIIEPRSSGDGVASTVANPDSDDVQIIAVGDPAGPGDVIIGPGLDGIIDTVPEGDEFRSTTGQKIFATENGTALTVADAASDDIQEIMVGDPVVQGDVVVSAGPDGELQTIPQGSEQVRSAHRAQFASDPALGDTDADGLVDGREEFLGSRPNTRDADSVLDSDFDGLTNQQELDGWRIDGTGPLVFSDPNDADSDNDTLPDVLEWAIFTNPVARDTDQDGLNDAVEFDITDPNGYFDTDRIDVALVRCADGPHCVYTPNASPVGTDPTDADTDNDLLNDGAEVNGWMVTVFGESPRMVAPDPFITDTDNDGLSDRAEFLGFDSIAPTSGSDSNDASDPTQPDTDGDGVTDKIEKDQNVSSGVIGPMRRSAVRRDQMLRVEFYRFLVELDGEAGRGEWDVSFSVETQDGVNRELFNDGGYDNVTEDCGSSGSSGACYEYDDDCGQNVLVIGDMESIFIDSGFGRKVVLREGDIVRVRSWVTEKDGSCSDDGGSGLPHSDSAILTGLEPSPINNQFDYFSMEGNDLRFSVFYRVLIITN